MKNKRKLITALVIVLTFVAGYLVGLLVDYPHVNRDEVSGTIGRVSNYRNTKATEADIELRNDLLTDTIMQKSVAQYMGFYYAKSLEFAKTIVYAVEQAKAEKAFAAQYATQIEVIDKYASFLDNSRKDLLMATLVCQSVEESSPEMLRNAITQANNIIAQMNHRNGAIISIIESLDAYILKTGRSSNENLNRAHDLLVFNQIGASIATRDKVMLKYFDKKQLFAKEIRTSPANIKGSMVKDLETLSKIYYTDMEKLGMWDKEALGLNMDAEELGGVLAWDAEKLGGVFALDSEKLGAVFTDTEKLGTGFTDAEKLGAVFTDAEELGAVFTDVEKLGSISQYIN
ncbi:MAG: hypothetical protein VB046_09445 [Paludibacter sp.]|nr:hypothetical protein [Paludibacter sp.]